MIESEHYRVSQSNRIVSNWARRRARYQKATPENGLPWRRDAMPPLDNTIGQRLEREAPVTHSRHVEDDSRNEIVLATASRRVGPRPPRPRSGRGSRSTAAE
jgi:hypothetical protein